MLVRKFLVLIGFSVLVALPLVLTPAPAFAQEAEDRAGARAAAEEGARAFDAGDYGRAIDYFARAEKLFHATPHLLYMGRARARSGRLVQAREDYLAIINEPLPPRANQILKDTRAMAEKELAELEPRLPYISVVVQGARADDVRVWMDGKEVPGPLIGIPQPVDPGDHRFQAKAIGMESSIATVSVREGTKDTVVLTLQEGGGLKPPRKQDDPDMPTTQAPKDPGPTTSGGSGMRIGAYTALGIGVVGVALGTLFVVQSGADSGEADDLIEGCPVDAQGLPDCDPATQSDIADLDESSAQKGTLAAISYGVGGAALVTGVVLLLLDSSGSGSSSAANRSTRPTLKPWVGFGSAGLTGTF